MNKSAKFNPDTNQYVFDPTEYDHKITFYLHKKQQGFAMDIAVEDRVALEKILKNNKIDYHTSGDDLPF
jgi:hypothetical protein